MHLSNGAKVYRRPKGGSLFSLSLSLSVSRECGRVGVRLFLLETPWSDWLYGVLLQYGPVL